MAIQVMKDRESYFTLEQIDKVVSYYWELKQYNKAIFFLTLFRTGRRVSELLGKPPFALGRKYTMSHYKGLRPSDLFHRQQLVDFEILKKRHVKKYNRKTDKTKDEEALAKERFEKKPFKVLLPVDKELFDLLAWYIEEYKVLDHERIFPFSRQTANRMIKEACKEKHIVCNLGQKNIRNKKTREIQTVNKLPHLHMFRHSFAIYVLKKNSKNPAALPMLKKLIQHSRIEVTEAYLQFTQADTKEFVETTWGKPHD